jgi:hypothetical protein
MWVAGAGCFGHAPRGRYDAASDQVCAGKVCYRVGNLDGRQWRLVHQEGTSIGFYSNGVGGIISANAACRDDAEAAPLASLTRQLLIGYTERKVQKQELVALDAREALHTRVDAKLDGVPMTLDLYVLNRDGCIFDLSYAAPPEAFARGEQDFAGFVTGFADTRQLSRRGS